MPESPPNIRLLDSISVTPELDLASELFHRINRVIPGDQEILSVPPDCPASDAVSRMRQFGYSQVPVVDEGKVLGVFSFRRFAQVAASLTLEKLNSYRCAPGDLPVSEFLETFDFCRASDEMTSAFDSMDQNNGVLVGTPDQLENILTPMDFLAYLYRVASPFVMVAEIELALRALLRIALSEHEIAATAERCLKSKYGEGKVPAILEDMSFEDYRVLISYGEHRTKVAPVFGANTQFVAGKLEQIGEIRNALFHFRRELTTDDREALQYERDSLLMKVTRADRQNTRGAGE